MGILDKVLRRHGERKESNFSNNSNSNFSSNFNSNFKNNLGDNLSHSELINQRAKALIEELVSPLSEPNQRLIEEVLTIITQTSSLPDSMVNKSAVQNTTKELLFQLVDPIPNPNKQLIDELLQLVTRSNQLNQQNNFNNSIKGINEKNDFVNRNNNQGGNNQGNQFNQNNLSRINEGSDELKSPSTEAGRSHESRIIKGQAGLKMQKDNAMAQAQYPSDAPVQQKKDKETKSIMNLLLEQIKELISISNNLNAKLKSHQVRLDTLEGNLNDVSKRTQDFDERMIAFEKNMEKFIGLYEVVTNQYNPFVETSEVDVSSSYSNSSLNNQGVNSNNMNDSFGLGSMDNNNNNNNNNNNAPKDIQGEISSNDGITITKKPSFVLDSKNIESLEQLGDEILSMSDDEFNQKIILKIDDILIWISETLGKEKFSNILKDISSKNDFIKAIMKEIHSN